MEAGQHLFEHVLPIVQKRRADPIERDDLIGFLLNLNKNGDTFTDVDITNFVRMLLLAATETPTRTLGNMLAPLFDNPDVLERLRQDRSLISKALPESLRMQPVGASPAKSLGRGAGRARGV